MFIVQTVKEKEYTAADLQKMLANIAPRTGNGNTMSDYNRKELGKLGIKMLSTYLRGNLRGELSELQAPFKIVTNGWGEFKHVEMSETGRKFDAKTIFRQMQCDENNGCTLEMVKV